MSKIKVFVDLDDTIFDTQSFKRDIFEVFVNCCSGMNLETVSERYKDFMARHGNFDPYEFAKEFEQDGANPDEIVSQISSIAENSSKYLFENRLREIKSRFDSDNYEFILFTKGLQSIQEAKVKACDLGNQFDQIIYVEGRKPEALKEAIESGERFILFEDREDTLDEIGKDHGAGELYLFRGEDQPLIYIAPEDPSLREPSSPEQTT